MIKAELIGAKELEQQFKATPSRVNLKMLVAINSLSADLVKKVKAEKLSGQVLRRMSTRLSRSINFRIENDGDSRVAGYVGTNVEYARIHEFGGTIHQKARKQTLFKSIDRDGNFKHHGRFVKKGKSNYAEDHHSGPRTIVMPQRSFLRTALAEMKGEIEKRIEKAVAEGLSLK